jgi:hypothetical protein
MMMRHHVMIGLTVMAGMVQLVLAGCGTSQSNTDQSTAQSDVTRGAAQDGISQSAIENSAIERPVVIGRGTMLNGTHFVATAAGINSPSPRGKFSSIIRKPGNDCWLYLAIHETGENIPEKYFVGESCYPRSGYAGSEVSCNAGILRVRLQTLPGVDNVRMKLIDGREVTSRVWIVPKRLRGPAGLYYQNMSASFPAPVSLTELDANGRVARTVVLSRVEYCPN